MRIHFLVIVLVFAGCATNLSETPEYTDTSSKQDLEKLAEFRTDNLMSEFCADHDCRENVRVRLETEDGVFDEALVLYWPVVSEGTVSVLPGETIFIEGIVADGVVTNLKHVEENHNPDRTLVFEFTQMDSGNGMVLNASNPFPVMLKYHLDMVDSQGNFHETSSCPLSPEGGVFEHWPHIIPELVVSNIRVIPDGDLMVCTY